MCLGNLTYILSSCGCRVYDLANNPTCLILDLFQVLFIVMIPHWEIKVSHISHYSIKMLLDLFVILTIPFVFSSVLFADPRLFDFEKSLFYNKLIK